MFLEKTFQTKIKELVKVDKQIKYMSLSCLEEFVKIGGIFQNLAFIGDDSDLPDSIASLRRDSKIPGKLLIIKSTSNKISQSRIVLEKVSFSSLNLEAEEKQKREREKAAQKAISLVKQISDLAMQSTNLGNQEQLTRKRYYLHETIQKNRDYLASIWPSADLKEIEDLAVSNYIPVDFQKIINLNSNNQKPFQVNGRIIK